MQALRRALVAVGAAAVITLFVRLRGSGGTPPRRGGWRELSSTELLPANPPPSSTGSD